MDLKVCNVQVPSVQRNWATKCVFGKYYRVRYNLHAKKFRGALGGFV